jgi:hypothetical protein
MQALQLFANRICGSSISNYLRVQLAVLVPILSASNLRPKKRKNSEQWLEAKVSTNDSLKVSAQVFTAVWVRFLRLFSVH